MGRATSIVLAHFSFLNENAKPSRGPEAPKEAMKKLLILMLVAIAACVGAADANAAGKKVAVYVEGDISKSDKSIVSSVVLARMSGNRDYVPYERNQSFIDALNKEQEYQLSGEVPEKEIREVGERLGVDYLIVVKVQISSDGKCHMSAELLKLVSAEIIKQVYLKRDYTDSDVLTAMASNVAYRLLNK